MADISIPENILFKSVGPVVPNIKRIALIYIA